MKRVQAMLRDGRLPAERLGRDYLVRAQDIRLVADRKPGRPPKDKPQQAAPTPRKAPKRAK